ncbi:hypothetical protein BLNAU_6127 [Blattamonas nauphoetae]|uniref:Uncharacterized protein n=1 Tax=Blattamonas nauphoetae TaxID=2049346 RepID=A0ABQ9Y566_9EUKA|nr:hypothetical protein BLNAU_6127 [Blattamonas nauphoetae]
MTQAIVALNTATDACLTDSQESPSTVDKLHEPFLSFVPNSELSFEDKSTVFCSLVALVKEDYPFDDALQDKAVQRITFWLY